MGTWDSGNFDGDSPRDFLADMVTVWERLIDRALAGKLRKAAKNFGEGVKFPFGPGIEALNACVLPTVEVLMAVAEALPCDHLPSPKKVAKWAEKALRIWDAEAAGYCLNPDFQAERRRLIEETFNRLSAHLPLNILELPTASGVSRCRPWASPGGEGSCAEVGSARS